MNTGLIAAVLFFAGCGQYGLFGILQRPLILCGVLGAAMGNVTSGMAVGAVLETAAIVRDTMTEVNHSRNGMAFAAMMAVIFAVVNKMDTASAAAAAMAFAMVGYGVNALCEIAGIAFLPLARSAAEKADDRKLTVSLIGPMLVSGILYAVCGVLLAGHADMDVDAFAADYGWLISGLRIAASLLPCIGLAVLLRNISLKNVSGAFWIGASAMAMLMSISGNTAFSAIVIVLGIGFAMYDYQSSDTAQPVEKKTGGSGKWW